MDPTDRAAAVESLLRQHADLPHTPWTPDQTAAALIAIRNAVDDFRDGLDDADDEASKILQEMGALTKRCAHPKCERWMLVSAVGRPREYCSDACRSSAPWYARTDQS